MKPFKDFTVEDIQKIEKPEEKLEVKTSPYSYKDTSGVTHYIEIIGKLLTMPRFVLALRLSDGTNIAIHDTRILHAVKSKGQVE